MKKITTFLLAVVFMAMSASATVTVNVRTSTGDAPYLYAWDGAGNKLNGEWPGTMMDESQTYTTTVDGLVWFTQTFEQDAINIVFNDGEDPAIQSSNIMGVTGTAFFTFDIEEGEYEDVTSTYISDTGFDVSTLPSTVAYVEGKEFAYFIAPATWTNCNVWAWNSITGTNFTTSGAWPGDPITLIGNTTDGYPVYQWIGADIVEGDSPTGIIFNNGTTQTSDLAYVPGGVYNIAGKLLYTITNGGAAGNIEMEEPVITESYIKFVGVNNTCNYKYTLETYEWDAGHGPQFQLTIEPVDASKPAYFVQNDLSDPNYWEPMFLRVTQEMAGEAMSAQDNIKRLYLGDVQLLENQFLNYSELNAIGFDLKKDYTLPAGCLLNAGEHLEEVDVKCDGTMTLTANSLPADKAFEVMVYTQEMYDVWNAYKLAYNCEYILSMPAITAVAIAATVDGENVSEQLPHEGFDMMVIEEPISELIFNGFSANVNIDVDEIFMDYAIAGEGEEPGDFTRINATGNGNGEWAATEVDLNVTDGLKKGATYTLYFTFASSYSNLINDNLRYDNGGEMYKVQFTLKPSTDIPGDVDGDGYVTSADITALYGVLLLNDYSSIVNGDQDGDGVITSSDVTTVYSILLGSDGE